MRWPRITINAAVLAAAVGINARLEANVRAVVRGDDRLAVIAKKLCLQRRILVRVPIHVAFEMNMLEPIRRILRRAARRCGKASVHDDRIAQESTGRLPRKFQHSTSNLQRSSKHQAPSFLLRLRYGGQAREIPSTKLQD